MASADITPKCPIYEHDASIITHLIPHLPHSISLIRRIQHGLAYPSSTAKILATFPSAATSPETPWLAARVDLSRGRETQIVVYSSLEKTHTSIAPIIPVTRSDTTSTSNKSIVVATFSAKTALLDQTRNQFLSLLVYIKKHLLPEYLSSLPPPPPPPPSTDAVLTPKTQNNIINGIPLIPPPPPQAFLLGSLHTALYALLMRSGIYAQAGADANPAADPLPGLRIHRVDYPPYFKYFFRLDAFGSEDCAKGHEDSEEVGMRLPDGYRFHDRRGRTGVRECHLDLVQSRTNIPRSRAQLSSMPGVAVYYDGDGYGDGNRQSPTTDGNEEEVPIAWGFLGLDGALATLHVEPAHRGKGLALPLCRQVMRRGMQSDVFGAGGLPLEDADRVCVGGWVHTEVAQGNRASRRVMEKIGGEVFATAIWTVVEVL